MVSLIRAVSIAFAIVAIAGVAWAQPKNDDAAARRAYQRGYKSLQAGKFADALTHYRTSYQLAPRPRTLFNMALCEEKLGQDEAAYQHFTEFVATAEERDAAFITQAQERLSVLGETLQGRVTIETDPPGAEVRIDGNRRASGRSPLIVNLRPGEHYVRVATSWSRPEERLVTVAPRGRSVVRVKLVPASSVAITVEPGDAVVERRGDPRTASGTYRAQVRPGDYEFSIRRRGYVTETLTVRVERGASVEQKVRLRPKANAATLTMRPTDASLTIDGTPATGERHKLVAGSHQLRVEMSGRQPWEDTLHLSPGETVAVDVALAPRRGHRWIGWLGATAGVAGVVAGGVVGTLGLRDVASADADLHDRGKRRALIADGLVVAGAVAIVVAWRYLRHSSSSARVERSHGGF